MGEKKFRLARTTQCKQCPWRKDAELSKIPGYERDAHQKLGTSTIAEPGCFGCVTKAMACHESPPGAEQHCVGWLMNQLGPGNNIGLRMWMRLCENSKELRTIGPQYGTFEETLTRLEEADEDLCNCNVGVTAVGTCRRCDAILDDEG